MSVPVAVQAFGAYFDVVGFLLRLCMCNGDSETRVEQEARACRI